MELDTRLSLVTILLQSCHEARKKSRTKNALAEFIPLDQDPVRLMFKVLLTFALQFVHLKLFTERGALSSLLKVG